MYCRQIWSWLGTAGFISTFPLLSGCKEVIFVFLSLFQQSLNHTCIWKSVQTEEASFAVMRITFLLYAWPTSPFNDTCSILISMRFVALYKVLLIEVRLPDVLERQGLSWVCYQNWLYHWYLKNILLSLSIFRCPWKFLNSREFVQYSTINYIEHSRIKTMYLNTINADLFHLTCCFCAVHVSCTVLYYFMVKRYV